MCCLKVWYNIGSSPGQDFCTDNNFTQMQHSFITAARQPSQVIRGYLPILDFSLSSVTVKSAKKDTPYNYVMLDHFQEYLKHHNYTTVNSLCFTEYNLHCCPPLGCHLWWNIIMTYWHVCPALPDYQSLFYIIYENCLIGGSLCPISMIFQAQNRQHLVITVNELKPQPYMQNHISTLKAKPSKHSTCNEQDWHK